MLGKTTLVFLIGWVLAFQGLGAQIPINFDTILAGSDTSADDEFGTSVAIWGNTAVVGAPKANNPSGETGAIYIYERFSGTGWQEVQRIAHPLPTTEDRFGESVAIHGDLILVGAPGLLSFQGAAFVFERHRAGFGNWGLLSSITSSDAAAGDGFGSSVAIYEDVAVVGAPFDTTAAGAGSGSAYVFQRLGSGAFGEVQQLSASDAEAGDFFGFSVDVSGDRIVAGAPGESLPGGNSGAAYVFQRHMPVVDAWAELSKLEPSSHAGGDGFGQAVALERDLVLAGAPNGGDHGRAFLFRRGSSPAFTQIAELEPAEGVGADLFGVAVALYRDIALVGSSNHADGAGTGAAYAFGRDQGGFDTWGQLDQILPPIADASAGFGSSIALHKESMVFGSPFFDSAQGNDSGKADLFNRQGDTWSLQGRIDNSEGVTSVALDGESLATGAGDSLSFYRAAIADFPLPWEFLLSRLGDPVTDISLHGDRAASTRATLTEQTLSGFRRDFATSRAYSTITTVSFDLEGEPSRVDLGSSSMMLGQSAFMDSGPDPIGRLQWYSVSEEPWLLDDSIIPFGPGSFGGNVAIAGDYAATVSQSSIGSTFRTYRRVAFSPNVWEEGFSRPQSNAETFTISAEGDIVAVGLVHPTAAGVVEVNQRAARSPSSWSRVTSLVSPAPLDDRFGEAVATDGNFLAVGAPGADLQGTDTGAVYVYARGDAGIDGDWVLRKILVSGEPRDHNEFGRAVDIDNGRIAVANQRSTDIFHRAVEADLPDLVPRIISSPPVLSPGGPEFEVEFEFENQGASPVGASIYLVLLSQDPLCALNHESIHGSVTAALDAGETQSLTASISLEETFPPGNYSLCVYLDPADSRAEANELNNAAAVDIEVGAGNLIFADDFETGSTSAWTTTVP